MLKIISITMLFK